MNFIIQLDLGIKYYNFAFISYQIVEINSEGTTFFNDQRIVNIDYLDLMNENIRIFTI